MFLRNAVIHTKYRMEQQPRNPPSLFTSPYKPKILQHSCLTDNSSWNSV
jgi:hypothetical protein